MRDFQEELNGFIQRAGSDQQVYIILSNIMQGYQPRKSSIANYRQGSGSATNAAMMCCILRAYYHAKDAMK